jgi:hypothetical protein
MITHAPTSRQNSAPSNGRDTASTTDPAAIATASRASQRRTIRNAAPNTSAPPSIANVPPQNNCPHTSWYPG